MRTTVYIILSILLVLTSACEKVAFEPEPANDPEALFEDLWTTFNTDYAPFEERNVDWSEQYEIYRPQVNPNTSSEELLQVFKQMLRTLDDGHVSLTYPGNVFYSNKIIDEEIDLDLLDLDMIKSNYLQNDFQESGYGYNTFGWINDIGYLHISAIGDNMVLIDEILDHFSSCKGLIVDLRQNQGGNFTYAISEFGRFTDIERLTCRSKTKNGPGPNDYTDWYDWYVYPSGEYFDKPIVVLVDRYTVSSGERMLLAFKTLPNVTIIGEPSSGALGTKIGKELANGWFYTLVTQKIEYIDGSYFEGVGIPPDIYSKNTLEEMAAGQDKTLELALEQF